MAHQQTNREGHGFFSRADSRPTSPCHPERSSLIRLRIKLRSRRTPRERAQQRTTKGVPNTTARQEFPAAPLPSSRCMRSFDFVESFASE